jgi:Na+-driven multidrug efflux pump
MRIISLSFIFAGVCIVIGSVFQALGKSIFSMFTSITRQLIVLIPAAYLLSLTGDVNAVWWAFPIAEVASLLISVIFFIVIYKKVISKIPDTL